jgi:hypothetical protein
VGTALPAVEAVEDPACRSVGAEELPATGFLPSFRKSELEEVEKTPFDIFRLLR